MEGQEKDRKTGAKQADNTRNNQQNSMPERRYRRGCRHRCPACWYGRLTKGARKKQLSQTQKVAAMKVRRAEVAAAVAKAKQPRKY